MVKAKWTVVLLMVIQVCHTYILLTANIDDLKNIGKRMVQMPIRKQVGNIMRRAYSAFNTKLGKAAASVKNDGDDLLVAYEPEDKLEYRRNVGEDAAVASDDGQASNSFLSLGKSASVYLSKIKDIFKNA